MKIKVFENNKLKTYEVSSMDALKEIIEKLKVNFRKINHTDEIINNGFRDKSYEKYCSNLENLIFDFKYGDYYKCKVCNESDHVQDIFCNCENRNIRVAKERRRRGEFNFMNKVNKAEAQAP